MEPQVTQSVLGTLGIDWKLFLAQLINFGIVVFVMWKWVYTPLLAMMDKRTKEITDGLKNAKDAKKNLTEAEAERDRLVQEARAAGHALLEDAQAKAEALRQSKLAETKQEIEKVVTEAKERISGERDAAFSALQKDIADMVALATEKVALELDDKQQHTLITKAINEIK